VRVAGFGESEAQRLLVDAGIGTVRGKVFAEAAERGDRTRSSAAVTDGIEVSPDDQIVAARRGAYLVSLAERTGGWQQRGKLAATPVNG